MKGGARIADSHTDCISRFAEHVASVDDDLIDSLAESDEQIDMSVFVVTSERRYVRFMLLSCTICVELYIAVLSNVFAFTSVSIHPFISY